MRAGMVREFNLRFPASQYGCAVHQGSIEYANSNKDRGYLVRMRDTIFRIIDFPFRFRNALRRKLKRSSLFSSSINQSDSEVTFYQSSVRDIIKKDKSFKRFRRIYDYREILEHVDYELGLRYLNKIKSIDTQLLSDFDKFRLNDVLGMPRKFNFPSIGKASPTTIRYVAVAAEIKELFKGQKIESIVEVGAGYGGQAFVLDAMSYFTKYCIFDLPEVQVLTAKYLSLLNISGIEYLDIHSIEYCESDLVISNYAFSELPKNLQEVYLERVLRHAKNGYLLMNSGMSNSTGRSIGKLSISQIKESLPHLQVLTENPLTGPDNYLIIWKSAV